MSLHMWGIVLCVTLMSIGQVLLKVAANALNSGGGLMELRLLIPVGAAAISYSVAAVTWIWALQRIPLGVAYPFVAVGFLLVPAMSAAVFDEKFGSNYVVGVVLICTGIVIISKG